MSHLTPSGKLSKFDHSVLVYRNLLTFQGFPGYVPVRNAWVICANGDLAKTLGTKISPKEPAVIMFNIHKSVIVDLIDNILAASLKLQPVFVGDEVYEAYQHIKEG